MQTVLIVIHLMIVTVLIGAVLLQKSEGGGLGMGGGAGFMSSRGTANLLTRTTAILALLFFLTSLSLTWLAGYDRKPTSILSTLPGQTQSGGATPVAPTGERRARPAQEGRRAAGARGPGCAAGPAVAITRVSHAGTQLASCIMRRSQVSETIHILK
ncbi:preprotein translocase subunit SecG [Bradyrhizobium oligotrophicum S58]